MSDREYDIPAIKRVVSELSVYESVDTLAGLLARIDEQHNEARRLHSEIDKDLGDARAQMGALLTRLYNEAVAGRKATGDVV